MLTNRAKICFLLVFLLIITVSCEKIAKQRARHYFEKGKQLYDTGQYSKAAKEIQNALVFDPTSFDAIYMKGMIYFRMEAFASAFDSLNAAVKQKPNDILLRLTTITAGIKAKNYTMAWTHAEQVLKIDKNNKEALFLGLYSLIANRFSSSVEKARKDITSLINSGYDDPRIYCLDAQINILRDDLARAETLLVQHFTSHEVWLETMKWLAVAYAKKNNFERVREIYNRIIDKTEITENKYIIQKEFASFLLQNNQPEFAEGVLRNMIEAHPDILSDKITLLNCLIVLGKLSEAEQLINIEIKNNPDNFDLKKLLIKTSLEKGGIEKTVEIAKNILSSLAENGPQYIELKNLIADIYFSNGKLDDSKVYSREVLNIQPNNAVAKFNLCRIALRNESSIGVIGDLRRLASENPGNAEYSYYLGLAHKARGEDILAQTALQDALAKSPGYKNALVALSEIYRERGIYKELERYVRDYLMLNPNDKEVESLLQRSHQRPSPTDNNTDNNLN